MSEVSVVGWEEGEIVDLGPGFEMRILEDGRNTRHALGLAVGRIAPHTSGPPQHRHAEHEEGFYVISGTVRFTVGDEAHDAGPGTLVMVPIGVPHTFANPGDEPATMLCTFSPDFYLRYFRDLRDARAAAPLTPATMVEIMGRYATSQTGPAKGHESSPRTGRFPANGSL